MDKLFVTFSPDFNTIEKEQLFLNASVLAGLLTSYGMQSRISVDVNDSIVDMARVERDAIFCSIRKRHAPFVDLDLMLAALNIAHEGRCYKGDYGVFKNGIFR